MTESIPDTYSNPIIEKIAKSDLVNQIGNTPLLKLPEKLFPDLNPQVSIYAKAEWFNPGGSVKDRPAWNMIKQGILSGELDNDKTIIDASSGNTGIALAMIGSALGFDVTICIPQNASPERLKMLRAYGANLVLTDPLEGTDGAIKKVRKLVQEKPSDYFYTDQYNNSDNWKAHYDNTASEILTQTSGKITHFVAGLGTSGTFTGISKKLRKELDEIKCISIQPDSPFHGLEGLKHMESAIKPGIYKSNLADINIEVSTKEAQQMTLRLAKEAGMLVGISSGANLVGAYKIAKQIEEGNIVTIFCDRGERYLTDNFWEVE